MMACVAATVAAQPKLTVDNAIVSVGDILFRQPRTFSYTITNSGNQPLILSSVTASCGCTKVKWSATPIAAGESATIEAEFDAQMLGTFVKELEVRSNASDDPLYLSFEGRVVTELTEDGTAFPINMGGICLSSNVLEFDDVNEGDKRELQLSVLNNSQQSYRPQLMHLPPYLTARYIPERVARGRVGRILLTLDSKELKNFGLTQTTIYLARYLGDKVSPDNEITVSAILLPTFADLTPAQRSQAPRLMLSEDSLDFSDMGTKKKETKVITLTNEGQHSLTISNLQVYGKALTVSLSNRVIEPGKQARLKVTVMREYLAKDKQVPRVLLIADDPNRPKTVIKVKVKHGAS